MNRMSSKAFLSPACFICHLHLNKQAHLIYLSLPEFMRQIFAISGIRTAYKQACFVLVPLSGYQQNLHFKWMAPEMWNQSVICGIYGETFDSVLIEVFRDSTLVTLFVVVFFLFLWNVGQHQVHMRCGRTWGRPAVVLAWWIIFLGFFLGRRTLTVHGWRAKTGYWHTCSV